MNWVWRKSLGLMLAGVLSLGAVASSARPLAAQTPTPGTPITSTTTISATAALTASSPAAPPTASAGARPFNVTGVNLVTNSGHEHPGTNFAGRSDLNVTWNWNPFWEDAPTGTDRNDPNYRTPGWSATFARDNPTRVRSGAGSDRWRNTLSVNKKAGIMQYVADLPVGAPVRFASWLQLWSNDDNAAEAAKSKGGDLKVRVCIDQDGGPRDLTDPALVCSDWKQPFDQWQQLTVDGIARNSVVNVIVWSSADTPILYNDVYVDESCFEILPAASAKGICAGAGQIETGLNVLPLPQGVGEIKITAEEQAKLPRLQATLPAPTTSTASTPSAAAAVTATNTATATVVASSPLTATTATTPTTTTATSPLTVTSTTTASLVVNARVSLNVRSQPSQTAEVIGSVQRGAVLPVLARNADGQWFQIDFDGVIGWVFASLTLPNPAARAAPVAK